MQLLDMTSFKRFFYSCNVPLPVFLQSENDCLIGTLSKSQMWEGEGEKEIHAHCQNKEMRCVERRMDWSKTDLTSPSICTVNPS